jgi:hypothetical protein
MKFVVNHHDAHKHSKMQQTTMHTSIPKCNKPRAFQNATNPNAINGSKARKESIVIHKKK